jgi:hypothetical protein
MGDPMQKMMVLILLLAAGVAGCKQPPEVELTAGKLSVQAASIQNSYAELR